jgi:two-component system phosphate regulon sensor histidine kinase PhoR
MTVTILLLTTFQVYWLFTLYNEEYTNIKRNTNVLFRDCLYKLQVDRFKKDTLLGKLPGENLFTVDILKVLKSRIEDTSVNKAKHGKNIIISISSRVDSVVTEGPGDGGNLKSKFVMKKGSEPDFIKSLHDSSRLNDSVPIVTIDSAYKKSLADVNLFLSFSISNLSNNNENCAGSFCTSVVPMGLFGLFGYKASFSQPYMKILKSIGPQFLLSVIMIGLTIISFVFIYRSLLQQKRLADIKNEFISNITHELKTPISTVSVAIEAIKNFNAAKDPERTTEYLNIADNELQRLTMLVDKVLKLSMFEQNQVDLKFELLDLNLLVSEVLISMKLQFEKFKAAVNYEPARDCFILADRIHITGVLYNLLDNALKYGSERPEIKINLVKQNSKVKLSIADNGIGIPAALKEKIFEKFFRVPHGDKYDIRGYGLGLSYVLHVITQHKGTISVESEMGKGSIFTIIIPSANV